MTVSLHCSLAAPTSTCIHLLRMGHQPVERCLEHQQKPAGPMRPMMLVWPDSMLLGLPPLVTARPCQFERSWAEWSAHKTAHLSSRGKGGGDGHRGVVWDLTSTAKLLDCSGDCHLLTGQVLATRWDLPARLRFGSLTTLLEGSNE